MKRLTTVLSVLTLCTAASSAMAMTKSELIANISKTTKLEASVVKKALKTSSAELGAALAKNKSVYVPNLGLFYIGETDPLDPDSDDDGLINDGETPALAAENLEIGFYPDIKDDRAIVQTYLDNYLSDAMNIHASVQDELARRSGNDPLFEGETCEGTNPLYNSSGQRSGLVVSSQSSFLDAANTFSLYESFSNPSLIPDLTKYWSAVLGKEMAQCYSSEYAQDFVGVMLKELSDAAIETQRLRKLLADAKLTTKSFGGNTIEGPTIRWHQDEIVWIVDGSVIHSETNSAFIANLISQEIGYGAKVSMHGFGSFSVSERAARSGSGSNTKVAKKKVVKFKPGADLSDRLN